MPARDSVLVDREDGGNLVVNPPREVWERGELSYEELQAWTCLVAAMGGAMLATLPQLKGGCINYWEAGNWALNDEAVPVGRKSAHAYRRVHLHLLGRSPNAKSPSWRWGEAPLFPSYAQRKQWAATHQRLTPDEVRSIVAAAADLLMRKYGFNDSDITPVRECQFCSYPFTSFESGGDSLCPECSP